MSKTLGITILLLVAAGCSRQETSSVGTPSTVYAGVSNPAAEASGNTVAANNIAANTTAANTTTANTIAANTIALPPGTPVHVRLQQTIDTKRNRPGDHFSATLDEPLVVADRVVVPRGTPFEGRVVTSRESGRLKGRAALALSLDSFELKGVTYRVNTDTATRVSGRHKKRNWLWIGGGSGTGAAVGAIASGGTGALIGAGAGAAAGTVGAAFTGKRNVSLPVESRVTFRLRSEVPLGS